MDKQMTEPVLRDQSGGEHMTTLRTAAQQALEILERLHGGCTDSDDGTVEAITVWCPEIIDDLRDALAETVQEPAAIVGTQEDVWKGYGGQWAPPGSPIKTVHMLRELPVGTLLYAAPPQRPAEPDSKHATIAEWWADKQRKPLTREEAIALWADKSDGPSNGEIVSFTRAIERAHGIT